MGFPANFIIVKGSVVDDSPLIIRDMGPWDKCYTVTNDVERVIDRLIDLELLPKGRRLFYYDSEGQLDEIVLENGRFLRFAPGMRE